MPAFVFTADDVLASDLLVSDGQLAWASLPAHDQSVLVAWVNKSRWGRGRRQRLGEAVYALNREGATARLGDDVKDSLRSQALGILGELLGP